MTPEIFKRIEDDLKENPDKWHLTYAGLYHLKFWLQRKVSYHDTIVLKPKDGLFTTRFFLDDGYTNRIKLPRSCHKAAMKVYNEKMIAYCQVETEKQERCEQNRIERYDNLTLQLKE